MIRVRFKANLDDPRPVNWPIKHPYWVSGESDHHSIVVAYADNEKYILDIDVMDEGLTEYTFTGRFPKPEWFSDDPN